MLNEPFLTKVEENMAEFFFESNWEYYSKIFLKKTSDFLAVLVF